MWPLAERLNAALGAVAAIAKVYPNHDSFTKCLEDFDQIYEQPVVELAADCMYNLLRIDGEIDVTKKTRLALKKMFCFSSAKKDVQLFNVLTVFAGRFASLRSWADTCGSLSHDKFHALLCRTRLGNFDATLLL